MTSFCWAAASQKGLASLVSTGNGFLSVASAIFVSCFVLYGVHASTLRLRSGQASSARTEILMFLILLPFTLSMSKGRGRDHVFQASVPNTATAQQPRF